MSMMLTDHISASFTNVLTEKIWLVIVTSTLVLGQGIVRVGFSAIVLVLFSPDSSGRETPMLAFQAWRGALRTSAQSTYKSKYMASILNSWESLLFLMKINLAIKNNNAKDNIRGDSSSIIASCSIPSCCNVISRTWQVAILGWGRLQRRKCNHRLRKCYIWFHGDLTENSLVFGSCHAHWGS